MRTGVAFGIGLCVGVFGGMVGAHFLQALHALRAPPSTGAAFVPLSHLSLARIDTRSGAIEICGHVHGTMRMLCGAQYFEEQRMQQLLEEAIEHARQRETVNSRVP